MYAFAVTAYEKISKKCNILLFSKVLIVKRKIQGWSQASLDWSRALPAARLCSLAARLCNQGGKFL